MNLEMRKSNVKNDANISMMQQVFELWTNIAGTYPRRIKVRFFFMYSAKKS